MLSRFYRILQLLSIDIVSGAVILLHFFSMPFGVSISWQIYFLLGAAIWVIYTVDHLRDAKQANEPKRTRYQYHARHHKILKLIVILLIVSSGLLMLSLPSKLLYAGLVLSILCMSYIGFQARLASMGLKELYVSTIYSLGILLAPIALSGQFLFYPFIIILFLSLLNLMIFSWHEKHEDEADEFRSIATIMGGDKLNQLILTVLATGLAVGLMGFQKQLILSVYFVSVLLIYLGMTLRLNWSQENFRYRTIGDGVFLLPLLFELL